MSATNAGRSRGAKISIFYQTRDDRTAIDGSSRTFLGQSSVYRESFRPTEQTLEDATATKTDNSSVFFVPLSLVVPLTFVIGSQRVGSETLEQPFCNPGLWSGFSVSLPR